MTATRLSMTGTIVVALEKAVRADITYRKTRRTWALEATTNTLCSVLARLSRDALSEGFVCYLAVRIVEQQ